MSYFLNNFEDKSYFGVKGKYRPEVDGIRAFAVIAVIINHFNKDLLPSGYLGVDMFFVISGYVITSSLASRKSINFNDFILSFFERRIKRIVPALVPFTIISSILICLFNPQPIVSLKTGITSLFGLSNLYLLKQSTNYFAESTSLNVFTHTWSLDVEEQFYVFFPILIWITGFASKTKKSSRNLLLSSIFLTVLSLLGFIHLSNIYQPAAYFLMPTRFWEMASGCLIFLILQNNSFSKNLIKIPPILIFVILLIILLLPLSVTVIATLLVVFFTSIFICCLRPNTKLFVFFTSRPVLHIGKISYSLYLWHWTILCISRWTIGIHIWSAPFQIIAMYFLALASYKWVETPFRDNRFKLTKSRTFKSGILSLFFTASFPFIFTLPALKDKLFVGNSDNEAISWAFDKNGNYIEKCHVDGKFTKKIMDFCLSSKDDKKQKIYVIGDSHARNYLKAIETTFYNDANIHYLTMGDDCAYLPPEMINLRTQKKVDCFSYQKEVREFIKKNGKQNDIVFVGQSLILKNLGIRSNKLYFEHVDRLAKELSFKKIMVVLMDGTSPPQGLMENLCSKQFYRPIKSKLCEIKKSEVLNSYKEFDRLATFYSSENKNFKYITLREGLCIDEKCGLYSKKGNIIWVDYGHITDEASKDLAPLLKGKLKILEIIN